MFSSERRGSQPTIRVLVLGLALRRSQDGARVIVGGADDLTSDLMTKVYAHLRAGVTKVDALRRAQLDAIARPASAARFTGPPSRFRAVGAEVWPRRPVRSHQPSW